MIDEPVASRTVTAGHEDPLALVDAALSGVDLAAPSTTKFGKLETTLAALAGLQASDVVAATISKAGNFSVRAGQSPRAQAAKLFVGVVTDQTQLPATQKAARAHVESGKGKAVQLLLRGHDLSWSAPWAIGLAGHENSPIAAVAAALHSELVEVRSAPRSPSSAEPGTPPRVATLPVVPVSPLIIEPRIRRMVRTAVASRPAVMLVGPPGTGKTQLINELLAEIAHDPACVGMSSAHEALTVTPDESWTSRELIGGETVDDRGRIRFTPGVVLQAISQDRWLVLDEANRADLDRIFGGLLTWLSGQAVDVGRTSTAPDAAPIRLGWSSTAQSTTAGTETLTDDTVRIDSVEYQAGSEWRLLGTYNALDAQRVFRFGLALGRRFAHVPIPPPDRAGFAQALEPRLGPVSDEHRPEVRQRILAVYEAHLAVEYAALGPAVFLDMPAYVAAAEPHSENLAELVAEAYLSSTGTWLARLEEDQLDRLGTMLSAEGSLDAEWSWVRSQLPALR